MKKVFILKSIVYGLIAILLVSTVLTLGCAKKEKEIKIGAILALTGTGAKRGEVAKNGIELALEEINRAGGINNRKVTIIYEDSRGLPNKSVDAMNKLINVDKVPVIIGPMASGSVLASAPIAEKSKTVIISPTASSPKITEAGDFVFRNSLSATLQGIAMAQFCYYNMGLRKVAILYLNTETGLGYKEVFEKEFKILGGLVVDVEAFEQEATDYRTQLTKISEFAPEAIYAPSYPKNMGLILRQAAEIGLKVQFLGNIGMEDQQVIDIAGKSAEGLLYTSTTFDPMSKDKAIQEYESKYIAKFGIPSDAVAAQSYDILKILALCIERNGYTAEGIKNTLYSIKDYPGISGKTTFDKNGDAIKSISIKTVKDGKFVVHSKYEPKGE